MVLNKICSKCKLDKHFSVFPKSSKAKSGLASNCKQCRSEHAAKTAEARAAYKRAYYEVNKDAILSIQKEDRQTNPEKYKDREALKYIKNGDKIRARVLAYQKKKPESYRAAGRRYRARTPDKQCAKSALYRANKLRATPTWVNDELEQLFLSEVYHLSQLRSACGIEHHVDHIVPLISEFVCGLHCMANLRVITGSENCSKSNKYWPDMP